jgi:hypothetical protein
MLPKTVEIQTKRQAGELSTKELVSELVPRLVPLQLAHEGDSEFCIKVAPSWAKVSQDASLDGPRVAQDGPNVTAPR